MGRDSHMDNSRQKASGVLVVTTKLQCLVDGNLKQEAQGPRVAHLSDIATADMRMLCNIFSSPVIAANEKINL